MSDKEQHLLDLFEKHKKDLDGDKVTAIDAYPRCNDWTKAENKYYCDAVNNLYSEATNN